MRVILTCLIVPLLMIAPVLKANSPPLPYNPVPHVVVSFTMTAENAERCRTGNGCDVIHLDELTLFMEEKERRAEAKGKASCKPTI